MQKQNSDNDGFEMNLFHFCTWRFVDKYNKGLFDVERPEACCTSWDFYLCVGKISVPFSFGKFVNDCLSILWKTLHLI